MRVFASELLGSVSVPVGRALVSTLHCRTVRIVTREIRMAIVVVVDNFLFSFLEEVLEL